LGKSDNDNDNDEWRRYSSRSEVARLQGFPESLSAMQERAYHMIGNAVAFRLSLSLIALLTEGNSSRL
jgi:site-specific DNA-cytosine methylase